MGTKFSEFVSATSVPATAEIIFSYNGGNYKIEKSTFDADITISPAGSTTQMQYNNAGTLAGASGALWSANSFIVERGYKFLPRGQATNETVDIGNTSGSAGARAVVIGGSASCDFPDGVAVGYNADITNAYTTAIGSDTDATGLYGIALGYAAQAGAGVFCIGDTTHVTTMVFGTGSHVVTISNPLTLTGNLTTGAVTVAVRSIATAAGTTTGAVTDHVVAFTGSTTQTYTLPACSTGRELIIKNRSTGNVTVNRAGADTIDGSTSITLTGGNDESVTLIGNSTDWLVV